MKLSESWLRTFVDPELDSRALAHALTFGGVEVEAIEPSPAIFDEPADQVFTTKPTPNRGDCLSVHGLAREVATITGARLKGPEAASVAVTLEDRLSVTLDAPNACPRYCGRLVRGVDARAATPPWMKARIERSGLRPISALVDITNYVMLELGQPLHAFDAVKLEGGIHVRFARAGERLALLNGETRELGADYLVIADEKKAVALAGIMGGADTAVDDATRDVFLESAFFTPDVIAGKSRILGFGSDSSFHFERGVDFAQTRAALERASALVLEICGGKAGPISEAAAALPERKPVALRLSRARRVLGIEIRDEEARAILTRLNFPFSHADGMYRVTPPSYRFDIAIEEDLIEELARVNGYDKVPAAVPVAATRMLPAPESTRSRSQVRDSIVQRGYHEVVTYSFVDRRWEEDFCGNTAPIALANPIASQMSVMRSSLIGGLIDCIAFNVRHKHSRVRVFEIGRCFTETGDEYAQPVRIGCAAYGDALPEQWGAEARRVDFFDVKGDLESLLATRAARFEAAPHPAFHPGKSARIVCDSKPVGWAGELHPRWQQKYELPLPPVLFEIDHEAAANVVRPIYREIPKFPAVRRDLAALFAEEVHLEAILDALNAGKPAIVADVRLFDVYRGKDLEKGRKSLAFSVLLQDTRKTLTDAEVESAVTQLRDILRQRFGATLR